MGDYAKCKWCGKKFEKGAFNKFKGAWTLGMAGKEEFCSKKCESEANGGSSPSSSGSSETTENNSNNNNNNEASARRAEAQAAKEQAKTQLLTSLFASADNEDNQMREAIDYINKMTFSTDSSELSNQLNELVSTGASSDKFRNGKTLKKACYEKMEFGIMKLRQAGANAEADFFEKKRKSIKPGWF